MSFRFRERYVNSTTMKGDLGMAKHLGTFSLFWFDNLLRGYQVVTSCFLKWLVGYTTSHDTGTIYNKLNSQKDLVKNACNGLLTDKTKNKDKPTGANQKK